MCPCGAGGVNLQRQCEHGNGGKARGSCQVAHSVANVFQKAIEHDLAHLSVSRTR
jgi:hypothetical protein